MILFFIILYEKNIYFLFSCFSLSFSSLTYAQYQLTERDNTILDTIESKIQKSVEAWRLNPKTFISKVENLLSKGSYSDRVDTILRVLIEDVTYMYDLYDDAIGQEEQFSMTPDECYDDEYFNQKTLTCELLWDQNNPNEDLSEEYFDQNFDNKNEWEGAESSQNQENYDASYTIDGDDINLKKWNKEASHEEIWKLFTKLIPLYYRRDFKLYSVYEDSKSDTIASVVQDSNENTKWNMDVNKALFYDEAWKLTTKESTHTLIHEFAHVLSLGKSQVDYLPTNLAFESSIDRFKEKCSSTFLSEGCLKKQSYLQAFITDFWTKAGVIATEGKGQFIYEWQESEFVTDYAATNPAEDIAESFTYFILKPKPAGETMAEKKILFFYQYDELVKLRNLIRNRL
jgi:hypothetical protein